MLSDLEYLESKFKNEPSIVLIGCHSAKFLNEKSCDKVKDAVIKYGIDHPVLNDDKMIVWKTFERRSWPGLCLVSPDRVPIFSVTGEGNRDVLDLVISCAYDYYF